MIAQFNQPVNSVEFWFCHFIESWIPIDPSSPPDDWPGFYNVAIRMARNLPTIQLRSDAWTFGGDINPRAVAELAPAYLYHLAWVFPDTILQKRIGKGKIHTADPNIQVRAKEAQWLLDRGEGLPDLEIGDLEGVPDSIGRLIGMRRYDPPQRAYISHPLDDKQ